MRSRSPPRCWTRSRMPTAAESSIATSSPRTSCSPSPTRSTCGCSTSASRRWRSSTRSPRSGTCRGRSPTSRRSACAGKTATAAADVWAVGVMLWEALAGRHPFRSTSADGTTRRIKAGAPPIENAPARPSGGAARVARARARSRSRRAGPPHRRWQPSCARSPASANARAADPVRAAVPAVPTRDRLLELAGSRAPARRWPRQSGRAGSPRRSPSTRPAGRSA